MDTFPMASEAEILAAVGLGTVGALIALGGFWLVTAAPRVRANPGDALIALGIVMCVSAGHLSRQDEVALWTAGGAAMLRAVFAFGHFVDERHHPTGGRDGETPEQRRARRRRRDRAVAEEAIRRYEASIREAKATPPPNEPIDLTPNREDRGDGPIGLPSPPPVEDAEYHEVDDAPAPAPDDGEILVRFETPIDEGDLEARPDRARLAMQAIVRQLGPGSRIVGIRARR